MHSSGDFIQIRAFSRTKMPGHERLPNLLSSLHFSFCPITCFPSVACLGVTHHPHTSSFKIHDFPFPRMLWFAWVVLLLILPGCPHVSKSAGGSVSLAGVREPHPHGWQWVLTRWGISLVLHGVSASSRLTWLPHMADSGQLSKAVEAGAIRPCEVYVLKVTLQYLHYFPIPYKSQSQPSIKGYRNWPTLLMEWRTQFFFLVTFNLLPLLFLEILF